MDDDEINRCVLDNIFSDYYDIDQAENGRVGLNKITEDKGRYSAVLLDAAAPEMSGLEVLRKMRIMGIIDSMPVFLIAAEVSADLTLEAYRLGVMDIIPKPVVPYTVLCRVNSIVELFRARRRLNSRVRLQEHELVQRAEKIAELNQGMIVALATAIEFRDVESGEHVGRIQNMTDIMLRGTELGNGLSSEEISNIALASAMHDVGKIAIPDSILNKPGKLTSAEYDVMKTHTVQGAMLLRRIPQLKNHGFFEYACDIARHHHERWDGSGYPDGLRGDEISLWAQVVSLADVYDALSSKRAYKEALPRETVVSMIKNGECGPFSPRLLRSFFSVENELRKMYETAKR